MTAWRINHRPKFFESALLPKESSCQKKLFARVIAPKNDRRQEGVSVMIGCQWGVATKKVDR